MHTFVCQMHFSVHLHNYQMHTFLCKCTLLTMTILQLKLVSHVLFMIERNYHSVHLINFWIWREREPTWQKW